jgi:hypothetical protein
MYLIFFKSARLGAESVLSKFHSDVKGDDTAVSFFGGVKNCTKIVNTR